MVFENRERDKYARFSSSRVHTLHTKMCTKGERRVKQTDEKYRLILEESNKDGDMQTESR